MVSSEGDCLKHFEYTVQACELEPNNPSFFEMRETFIGGWAIVRQHYKCIEWRLTWVQRGVDVEDGCRTEGESKGERSLVALFQRIGDGNDVLKNGKSPVRGSQGFRRGSHSLYSIVPKYHAKTMPIFYCQ